MREIGTRLIAAGLFAALALQGAGASESYRLLHLGGTFVKWGDPVIGTRARVTYALAGGRLHFPDARNCRSIVPVTPLLRRSSIALDAFLEELDAAFGIWSKAADITFVPAGDPAKADILIGAQVRPRGRAYTNVAYHENVRGEARSIRQSLICLNPATPWKIGFDGNMEVYDLRYTLLHEIGHAIGLDHPGPSGQIMSFKYHENYRGLRSGDMIGASLLYGKRGTMPTVAQPVPARPPHSEGGTTRRQEAPLLSLGGETAPAKPR